MCISPRVRPDGAEYQCRDCWQCRENRINDLVGRCMAEQQTSDQAFSVTLTYAGDTPNAAVLCYRDIQLFLKRMRKAEFNVRYIVAGEYGEKRGRAHWHIILFLRGKKLEVVQWDQRENDFQVVLPRFDDDEKARIQFEPWSSKAEGRGFVYFQRPDYGGFRYAMKYALKSQDGLAQQRALGMSKLPPLGHAFFMNMADNLVEARLPVQLPTYAFKGVKDKKGKHLQFFLQGRMRELFLDHYQTAWRLVHGSTPPSSPWYQERYLDKIELRRLRGLSEDRLFTDAHDLLLRRFYTVAYSSLPRGMCGVHHFRLAGRRCSIVVDGNAAYFDLNDGKPEWLVEKCEETALRLVLLRIGVKPSGLDRLCAWLLYLWDNPAFPL